MGKRSFAWLLGLALVSSESFAAKRFETLRQDTFIPDHCRQVKLSDFSNDLTFFTLSTFGAHKKGFDYEHPIKRKMATPLWRKAKKDLSKNLDSIFLIQNKAAAFDKYYSQVMKQAPLLDFNLSSEGEVLEILGTLLLKKEFNDPHLFITGSIAYHGVHNKRTLGELDFLIADTRTCKIYAVGEAKLNPRSLSKARRQLQRFSNFLAEEKREMAWKALFTSKNYLKEFFSQP